MNSLTIAVLFFAAFCLGKYSLTDNFSGTTFYNNFNFDTESDPTHGYVNYVNQSYAQSLGLINASSTSVYMGADHKNIASGRGRNSVRLVSKKAWNYGLVIIDLQHMPTGCGTWPAFWMVGPNWPNSGEIDIIEGVDTQTAVDTTLHTSAGCNMSSNTANFTGHWGTGTAGNPSDNCYINAPNQQNNQGCGIVGPANSYGAPFNSANGGVYATNWQSNGIAVWWWPRASIPSNIQSPDPTTWGKPYALFPFGPKNCPSSHFANLNIVFDLTFCGDWDGAVFSSDCPADTQGCTSFVQNNPSAFQQAYWSINYIHVYAYTASDTNGATQMLPYFTLSAILLALLAMFQ